MEAVMGKVGSAIASAIGEMFKSLGKQALEWGATYWKEIGLAIIGMFALSKIGGMIGGLFSGKSSGAATAGKAGGAVEGGGALAALGGDLAKAAGWLVKGVAIGASMFAIGFGVEKLAQGLTGFQDLDWETIGKGVTAIGAFALAAGIMGNFIIPIGLGAAAIGALGLAVSQFPTDTLKSLGDILQTAFNGISKIIDAVGTAVTKPLTAIGTLMEKITAMRTAVIEATTQQILTLSQIPSDKMLSAAAGIDAIKKALDGFSPGFLSGLSSGLGSIFAADEASALNKMAMLGPRLGEAANGYTAFKTAIAGMNLANLAMTSEQTDSFTTLTNNLPKFTSTITNLGAQAPNISAAATAIGAFRTATEGFDLKDFTFSKEQLTSLADGTTKLRALSEQLTNAREGFQKLDNQGLTKIKDGVEGLSKAFKDFNESFVDKFLPKFDALKSKTQEGLLTDLGSKLDTLNSNVTSLVSIETDSKKYLDTIASKRPGVVSGGRG
jgi:hypothetical protein